MNIALSQTAAVASRIYTRKRRIIAPSLIWSWKSWIFQIKRIKKALKSESTEFLTIATKKKKKIFFLQILLNYFYLLHHHELVTKVKIVHYLIFFASIPLLKLQHPYNRKQNNFKSSNSWMWKIVDKTKKEKKTMNSYWFFFSLRLLLFFLDVLFSSLEAQSKTKQKS